MIWYQNLVWPMDYYGFEPYQRRKVRISQPLLPVIWQFFSCCRKQRWCVTCVCLSVCRRMKLEKELVAQLWRICWDDIQMSNLDKVLRSGSRITLSLVSTHTRTCTHTHTHTHTRTCTCTCTLSLVLCLSPARLKLRLTDNWRWKPASVCKDWILQGQRLIFLHINTHTHTHTPLFLMLDDVTLCSFRETSWLLNTPTGNASSWTGRSCLSSNTWVCESSHL